MKINPISPYEIHNNFASKVAFAISMYLEVKYIF